MGDFFKALRKLLCLIEDVVDTFEIGSFEICCLTDGDLIELKCC